MIIGENEADDSLILSLRNIQYSLAWERCRQLQAEDAVVKGKVLNGNKGGVVALVEGLREFVPFSQISTISHDRVSDIATVLQPGDSFKVMILSHDRDRGRVSLSTKKLEPSPRDMIHNPKLVFEKAEEMAQIFRQRIAQAETMARADMLRLQTESQSPLTLSSEGILGPLTSDLPAEGLDLSDIPFVDE